MSKASSVRSNPVFNRYGILERELEQYWRKSISGEDNSIPRRLSYQFRSAGIGYQPRRAQETTFLELNSASRAAWAKCALLVREYDKGIILEWHKNLDTLLVFVSPCTTDSARRLSSFTPCTGGPVLCGRHCPSCRIIRDTQGGGQSHLS